MTLRVGLSFVIVALTLACSACGTDVSTRSTELEDSASPEIMAAVTLHLATDGNTFEPEYRFRELLILDRTHFGAADFDRAPIASEPLTSEEREAITRSLADIGPIRFVTTRDDWIGDGLQPVIAGSAIFTLAPVVIIDRETAHVGANIWCGGTCGFWATFVVEVTDGEWAVTGSTGPTAIS